MHDRSTDHEPTEDERTASTDTAPDRKADDEASIRDEIEAALRTVRDPRIDVDVFEAGLIEGIDVDDGRVTVEAALSAFGGDATQLSRAMLAAVRDVEGVTAVDVEPVAPSGDGRTSAGAFDRVIAVASAKGGVGKTTVATGLACALADDDEVGLFDADVHGPNVPRLLGIEGPIRSTDEGDPLPVPVDAGMEAISVGLMESGAPLAWRGAMAHDAVAELFEDAAWGVDDTLVIDLPPGTGDVVLTTLQEVPVDGVVVVTTPFHAAVADTARTVELFRDNGVPVLGAVVNMAERECPSCGDEHALFPGGTDDLGADVLAELPFDPAFQEGPAPGDVPAAMADLAGRVRKAAATAGEVDSPDGAVDLRGLAPDERKERVRSAFTDRSPGDPFHLVSDRDPSPVRRFLADLAGVEPDAFEEWDVQRRTPDAWVLSTVHP